ncbi:MAG TPA: dipeptidase [bacterium]|nr:dipeptidase [bacterium]
MPSTVTAAPAFTAHLDQARDLHARHWVIDGHADTFYEVMDKGHDFFDNVPYGHTDYGRFLKGAVDLQIASVYTPKEFMGPYATEFALKLLWHGLRTIDGSGGRLIHVTSQADLDQLGPGSGKLGFMFSLEGGSPLNGSIELLEMFQRLGIRAVGLVHNHRNELADGAYPDPGPQRGMTEAGKAIVRRMEELGMVVDVAHIADPSFEDLLGIITKPIWASHALCRAIQPLPRNLSDEMIRAIAATGGVIGVDFIVEHMKPITPGHMPHGSVYDICDHVDHIVGLVGIDHVGIGSDFDGYFTPVEHLADVGELPHLTAALLERGYGEADLGRFLGGNFLRVLRAVLPVHR